jgi:hypothetical protein
MGEADGWGTFLKVRLRWNPRALPYTKNKFLSFDFT